MKLSYSNSLFGDEERHTIEAEVTTDHPASSYGQPVIVLPDGGALDLQSWIMCNYKVEEITPGEKELLDKVFKNFDLMMGGNE